ncbi:MAG TPA: SPOR domain-containing protein [Blastocatellia bacterium]|nr:SPOR domain-containing protein [Blastocatellia bacterium]
MQYTAIEATCPLCKHPVSASTETSDPTRLCENCRRIVQTIRPTSNPRVAVIDSPKPCFDPRPEAPVQLQTEAPLTATGLPEEADDSLENATQICESSEVAVPALGLVEQDPFNFDELFEADGFFGWQEEPRHATETSPRVAQITHIIDEPLREAPVQPATPYAFAEPPSAMVAVTYPVSPAEISDSDPTSDHHIGLTTDAPPARESVQDEVALDPLADAANSTNYLPTDYPVLVSVAGHSKFASLRLPLVAALMVCCGIAGYFLIYRPSIQASQSRPGMTQPQTARADHTPAAVTESNAASQLVARAAAPVVEAKESQGARTGNEAAGGRYSLQAAAFPNETGANEFCERLKRAGVPAYVVSAEIAGRGRWFRVRVGRFETVQDAEKFASEARLRARSSGLNLQLIVSSYDKP